MKRFIPLACALLIGSTAFAQHGQVPNIGFENWTTYTLFENPEDWSTSNFSFGSNSINVTKETDANSGSFSVKIVNSVFEGDTSFGFAYLGEIGEDGPSSGITYLSNVDRIEGAFKYNVAPGDTASILVFKFLAGNVSSVDNIPIVGSQANFTNFSFNINGANQDQIFIALLASNPLSNQTPNLSTWVQFDDISLTHSVTGPGAALPNPGFENWEDVDYEDPNGWASFNKSFAALGDPTLVKTIDANSGSFAALLETKVLANDTFPGALIYGTFENFEAGPVLFNGSPTAFEYDFKYNPSGADTGFVVLEFSKAGISIGTFFSLATTTPVYTLNSIPISLPVQPDSVQIIFFAGDNPGSQFFVDNARFSGGNTSVNEVAIAPIKIFPNPVNDQLNMQFEEFTGTLEFRAISGQLVAKRQLEEATSFEYGTSHLAEGTYLVILRNDEGARVEKVVVRR